MLPVGLVGDGRDLFRPRRRRKLLKGGKYVLIVLLMDRVLLRFGYQVRLRVMDLEEVAGMVMVMVEKWVPRHSASTSLRSGSDGWY